MKRYIIFIISFLMTATALLADTQVDNIIKQKDEEILQAKVIYEAAYKKAVEKAVKKLQAISRERLSKATKKTDNLKLLEEKIVSLETELNNKKYNISIENNISRIISTIKNSTKNGWLTIFFGDSPDIWGIDYQGRKGYAIKLSKVPDNIRYLKITRSDTGEYHIINIKKSELNKLASRGKSVHGWNGSGSDFQLGIYNKQWGKHQLGEYPVYVADDKGGWGLGKRGWWYQIWLPKKQAYLWNGQAIPPTFFEISVKSGDLTTLEAKHALTGKLQQ